MDRDSLGNFHATNPFGNEMEANIRWDTLIENLLESTITEMFPELMSDYVSNSEQNAEITAAAEQPSSSPASPNSTNLLDSAENTTQGNAWPPLEVTDYSVREWPNSNNKPSCETSTAEEITSQNSNLATPLAAPRIPSIHRDPLGFLALTNSADQNPFSSAYTQQAGPSKTSNNQNENPPTQIEDNPLRYVFKTPPPRSLSFGLANTERPTYTPSSKISAEPAPDSIVTKIRKESQEVREDLEGRET